MIYLLRAMIMAAILCTVFNLIATVIAGFKYSPACFTGVPIFVYLLVEWSREGYRDWPR